MRAPTLSDIARLAGVSVSAVSKALSNGGGKTTKVSSATRARILSIASSLDYRPNEVARIMHHGKSKLIGLLFPSIYEPFYVDVISHLHDHLSTLGYLAVSSSWRTDSGFSNAYDAIMRYRPAGIISCHYEHDYSPLIPTVLYNNIDHPSLDTVLFSSGEHILAAIHYLLSLGHQRIGSIGRSPQEVLANFKNAGVATDSFWHRRCFNTYASAAQVGSELLQLPVEQRPTAVICGNDQTAIGFINACQSQGLQVPTDISVIGSDDLSITRYLNPSLTTFDFQAAEVADQLVELLFRRIKKRHAPVQTCRINPTFIIRNSCASPAS